MISYTKTAIATTTAPRDAQVAQDAGDTGGGQAAVALVRDDHLVGGARAPAVQRIAVAVTVPARAPRWWVMLRSTPIAVRPGPAWITAAHEPVATTGSAEARSTRTPILTSSAPSTRSGRGGGRQQVHPGLGHPGSVGPGPAPGGRPAGASRRAPAVPAVDLDAGAHPGALAVRVVAAVVVLRQPVDVAQPFFVGDLHDPAPDADMGDEQRQQHAPVGDHRGAVLVPVGVLARQRAVEVYEAVDHRVVRRGGWPRQLCVALDHGPRPEVGRGRVEAGPPVAAQVGGLGAAVGHRDADGTRGCVQPYATLDSCGRHAQG